MESHDDVTAKASAPARADVVVRTSSAIYVDADTELAGGWLAIREGRIVAIGDAGRPAPEAGEVIDVGDRVVTPGFVNTHHHIFQNLCRSYAPVVNSSLFTWSSTLSDIWAGLTEQDVYVSTYVGIAELLLGGCTTSSDNLYVHPRPFLIDASVRAAVDAGFRFFPTRAAMNKSRKDGFIPADAVVQETPVIVDDYRRVIETWHDPDPGALVRVGLSPTTPWSGDDDLVAATVAVAEEYDVRIHSHLSEDRDEYAFCMENHGCTPVDYFIRQGLATERTWVAHFAYPTDEEIARLAEYRVGVSHCPSSNMLICGETARVQYLREQGIDVGLGCDGSASTDHASLWQEARTALLLGRFRGGPEAMSARDVLDVATRGSAACLGWDDEIGHLRPGALADLVAWDLPPVALAGSHTDPLEALLRCGPARAWYTLVGGRALVAEGEVTLPEMDDALNWHAQASRRLQRLP